jgi:hypothetical protein
MIAPILPRSGGLIEKLSGKVDHVLIDRLNYSYANRIYEKNNLKWAQEDPFFVPKARAESAPIVNRRDWITR